MQGLCRELALHLHHGLSQPRDLYILRSRTLWPVMIHIRLSGLLSSFLASLLPELGCFSLSRCRLCTAANVSAWFSDTPCAACFRPTSPYPEFAPGEMPAAQPASCAIRSRAGRQQRLAMEASQRLTGQPPFKDCLGPTAPGLEHGDAFVHEV